MILLQIARGKIRRMADDEQPSNDDQLRAFVAQKLGDLQAEFARLIAALNLITPVQANQLSARNRRLLYVLIVLVVVLYILLGLHIAVTAGWLRS